MTASIAGLPDGTYEAEDVMEGDGVTDADLPIRAAVTVDGDRLAVDFSGSAPQVDGNCNAPLAVAKSAVYFVVRCVTDPTIPPNHGCYEPVSRVGARGVDPEPEPAGGRRRRERRDEPARHGRRARGARRGRPDRVTAGSQGR